MKDYKIISRFYRMAEEKIYILLAHGTIAEGSSGGAAGSAASSLVSKNIYSVVENNQRLLTKLYIPTNATNPSSVDYVLPLLSDICKGVKLYTRLKTNVKVSACNNTFHYAGLYECNHDPTNDTYNPTRIFSFNMRQSFTLVELYDWLNNTYGGIRFRLIFVGCIGPVHEQDLTQEECISRKICIDHRYVDQVNKLKLKVGYTSSKNVDAKKLYERNLKDLYPPLIFTDQDKKFPVDL